MVSFWRKTAFWTGAGIALRVGYAWAFGDPLAASDATAYYADALHLLHGEARIPWFPPGLPLLLAGWMALAGTGKIAITACIIAVYALFNLGLIRLFPERKQAVLPLALFALMPAAIHQSVAPLTHLLLATCLVWAWVLAGSNRAWLAGLAMGLGILVRPAAGLAAIVVGWRRLSGMKQRAVFAGFTALLPAIWLVFITLSLGKPMINEYSAYNFFLGNNPYTPLYKTWWLGSHEAADTAAFGSYVRSLAPDGQPQPADFSRAGWQHIVARPDLFAIRTLARMRTLLAFDTLPAGDWRDRHPGSRMPYLLLATDALLGIGLLLLAGIGLISSFLSPQRSIATDVLWMLLALAAPYWLAFSHPTYHLPLLPFLAVFAGEGWGRLWNGALMREKKQQIWVGGYILVIILIQIEWIINNIVK